VLKRNTIANFIGQGWVALMGLAFIPVYIRYLGVEAWGLVGFMSMLQAWFVLLDMGLTPTLSREMARFQAGAHSAQSIRNLLRSLEVIYGGVALVVVLSVWFAASWIATSWLGSTELPASTVSQAISVMGLVLAARMVEQVYRGAIQGLQRLVWLNGAQSLLATLRWGGAVAVLAWVDASIEAFFLWQGLVSLLGVIVLARQTYHWLPSGERSARFDLHALVEVRRFAGGMALITLLSMLLIQIDKIVLSNLLSLSEYGHYMLAVSVAGALFMLIQPIGQAWSPRLIELHAGNNHVGLVSTYHLGAQLVTVTLGSAAAVFIFFSYDIIFLWSGDADLADKTYRLVSILTLGNLLNGFMWIPYQLQLAHGWTSLAAKINLVAIVFIIPAIFWATPRYGAEGAAWVWVALNASYVFIGVHFMYRKILEKEKWNWYLYDVILPFATALVSALAIRTILPLDQLPLLAQLLFLGIASIIIIILAALAAPAVRQHCRTEYVRLRNLVRM
jgi:O-antigen/teichoic acid export membrane protein